MISFRDRKTIFSILIPTSNYDRNEDKCIIEELNHSIYKLESQNHYILDIDELDWNHKKLNSPCYIGYYKECLYIKNYSSLGNQLDHETFKTRFEKYTLINIYKLDLSISFSIYQNSTLTLRILKSESTDTFRKIVDQENKIEQQDNDQISDEQFQTIVQKLIFNLTGNNDLNNVILDKYVQVEINELLLNHEFQRAFLQNFPNLTNEEVSSAWVGAETRNTLPEDLKNLLYPDKITIKRIIGSTIQKCISPEFKLLRSGNLKHKQKTYLLEIGQLGYRAGSIELTVSVRFLEVEKYLKTILNNSSIDYRTLTWKVFYTKDVFREKIDYISYSSLALKLFWRIVYIQGKFIPEAKKLAEYNYLNHYVNYDDNPTSVLGISKKYNHKLRNGAQYENPVIAILARDENWEYIVKREVLDFIDDDLQKELLLNEYIKMKNSI